MQHWRRTKAASVRGQLQAKLLPRTCQLTRQQQLQRVGWGHCPPLLEPVAATRAQQQRQHLLLRHQQHSQMRRQLWQSSPWTRGSQSHCLAAVAVQSVVAPQHGEPAAMDTQDGCAGQRIKLAYGRASSHALRQRTAASSVPAPAAARVGEGGAPLLVLAPPLAAPAGPDALPRSSSAMLRNAANAALMRDILKSPATATLTASSGTTLRARCIAKEHQDASATHPVQVRRRLAHVQTLDKQQVVHPCRHP